MNELISILWSLLVLFLWFETNVFYEYFHRIPFLSKFLGFQDYDKNKEYYGHCSYQEFLPIQHNNFLVKLISCPYCLGFWTSLGTTFAFSDWKYFPMVYFGSLLSYFGIKKTFDHINKSK